MRSPAGTDFAPFTTTESVGDRPARVKVPLGATASTYTFTVSDETSSSTVTVTAMVGQTRHATITGTPGNDVLLRGAGNDILDGRGGDDLLCGGKGDDRLPGGPGADRFSGGPGRDTATDLTPTDGDTTDGTIP